MPFLRTALLLLSRSQAVQNAIVRVPISRRAARRFVAGESMADAIAAVHELNARGMAATLDHLGENVVAGPDAEAATAEYLVALEGLYLARARCNVSLKLTQMGLDLDPDLCDRNVRRILDRALEFGNFVRIDMEGSEYTGRTIALYRRLRREYRNVGLVIQAYLHRSRADVAELIAEGMGHFRLCKGAYDEPADIAYRDPARVAQALEELVSDCLSPGARSQGTFCGVASHDEHVVNYARAYAYQHEVPASSFEFQMLYGIRRELQADLVRRGYPVRIYVPYGTAWYPYFMRRLAERPANLFFFLRAFFGD